MMEQQEETLSQALLPPVEAACVPKIFWISINGGDTWWPCVIHSHDGLVSRLSEHAHSIMAHFDCDDIEPDDSQMHPGVKSAITKALRVLDDDSISKHFMLAQPSNGLAVSLGSNKKARLKALKLSVAIMAMHTKPTLIPEWAPEDFRMLAQEARSAFPDEARSNTSGMQPALKTDRSIDVLERHYADYCEGRVSTMPSVEGVRAAAEKEEPLHHRKRESENFVAQDLKIEKDELTSIRSGRKRRRRKSQVCVGGGSALRCSGLETTEMRVRDLVQRTGNSNGSFVVRVDCQNYEVSVKKLKNNSSEVISVGSDSEPQAAPKPRRRRSLQIRRQQLPQLQNDSSVKANTVTQRLVSGDSEPQAAPIRRRRRSLQIRRQQLPQLQNDSSVKANTITQRPGRVVRSRSLGRHMIKHGKFMHKLTHVSQVRRRHGKLYHG